MIKQSLSKRNSAEHTFRIRENERGCLQRMSDLYRKTALDKLSSPEQLDKMIRIASPMFWIAAVGGALIAVMIGTFLVQMFLTFFRGQMLLKLRKKMILISSHGMLSHMLKLPMNFFEQRYAGDLSQRVTNNNNVNSFLTGDLAQTVFNCFVAVFYLILMLFYSPLLTLVSAVCIAFELIFMRTMSKTVQDDSMKSQQELGKMTGTLFSGLSITSTLKASGTENVFLARLLGNYAKSIVVNERMIIMTVTKEQNGSNLIVYIEGKLDAMSSPKLEEELGNLAGVEDLVLDLKDLLYTSSAGLRVFLNAQKIMDDQGSMVVRNANEDVMDIFKETGFLNILDIED